MHDNSKENLKEICDEKIFQTSNPDNQEFDRIVGNPITLKEGDLVRIEGTVFLISAIHPETKKGKRTIKLKQPVFEKSKQHSFEPFPHKNQDKCPRTPTWIRTGRHG